jgi:hypothetical protein
MLVILPILLCARDWSEFSLPFNPIMNLHNNSSQAWRTIEILRERFLDDSYSPHAKYIYSYQNSSQAFPDSIYILYWDSGSSVWDLQGIYTYIMNADGNRLLSLIRYWDYGQTMNPYDFYNFFYDSQNRLTRYVWHEFNNDDMMLYQRRQYYYLYPDVQGLQTVQVDYNSESGTELFQRTDYSFDAQGRIIDANKYYSTDSLVWNLHFKTHLQYHPNDTTDYNATVDYIARVHPFQALTHQLYESPNMSNGMLSSITNEGWDGITWNPGLFYLYSYNPQYQLLTLQIKVWTGTSWTNDMNHLFTYHTNGNLAQHVEYFWGGTNWIPAWRYTFTYEQYTSAEDNVLPPVSELKLQTIPNPFTDELTIRIDADRAVLSEVSVYNTKGQLIRKLETAGNSDICWDGKDMNKRNVPNGIYFIRAATAGMKTTAKALKIR